MRPVNEDGHVPSTMMELNMRWMIAVPFAAACIGTAAPCFALDTGRSVALDTSLTFKECLPHDAVCGLMSAGTYRLFNNRCEARAAGAHRILVGVCEDDD